jgi:hypothetical protein
MRQRVDQTQGESRGIDLSRPGSAAERSTRSSSHLRRSPYRLPLIFHWTCCLEGSIGAKDTEAMAKKIKSAAKIPADLSSREAVKRFRDAAAEFTKEGTRSKESAMKVLVESGIYTESGELTKNYR